MSSQRLERERAIVRQKLPPNTQQVSVRGFDGWMYEVTCQFGFDYTLFLYWDGSLYKVRMVLPEPDAIPDSPHKSHYFDNGVICLTQSIGYPRLQDAYAKSVLFVTAWSGLQVTGQFEF